MHVNVQKLKEILRETRVSYDSKLQKEEQDVPDDPWSMLVVAENSDIGFKGAMVSLCSKIMMVSYLVIFQDVGEISIKGVDLAFAYSIFCIMCSE